VCNADLSFTNVVARYPGSTHDSHIFNHSNLNEELEEGEYGNGWLLGKVPPIYQSSIHPSVAWYFIIIIQNLPNGAG
jgi:hypothetical protein